MLRVRGGGWGEVEGRGPGLTVEVRGEVKGEGEVDGALCSNWFVIFAYAALLHR